MDLHNLDNVVQLNWVTGLPDAQRIILGTSKHDMDFGKIFFDILERKGIEYTFEKNEGSQKLLVKIGEYTCIVRSLDTEHVKAKTAFIEGWIPEHELMTPHNKWKINKFIDKDELTRLKNHALNMINDTYGLCKSEWEGEEQVDEPEEETAIEETASVVNDYQIEETNLVVDRINLSSVGRYYSRVLQRFIKYLTDNAIPFSYEEYNLNRRWIFNINGYSCLFTRNKKKKVFLEGWIPDFESYSEAHGHRISSCIDPKSLTMLKNNIIAQIRTDFNLENCTHIGLYDDNTLMPIGVQQGKKLSELRADVLLKYNTESGKNIDFDLYLYVQENLNRIQGQYRMEQKESHTRYLSYKGNQNIVTFKCPKKTFATRKMAMEAIVKNPRKGKNGEERKRPIRAYECRNCSGWHLTSKTVEEYKENVQKFNQETRGFQTGAEELAGVSVAFD